MSGRVMVCKTAMPRPLDPSRRQHLLGLPVARRLAEAVADHLGVSALDVLGHRRHRPLVVARWAIWTVLRARGWSLPKIGDAFGRDHATVIFGLHRAGALRAGVWATPDGVSDVRPPDVAACRALLQACDAICAELAAIDTPAFLAPHTQTARALARQLARATADGGAG
jgi:hypothetical protein